jgi:hypothetical protein
MYPTDSGWFWDGLDTFPLPANANASRDTCMAANTTCQL